MKECLLCSEPLESGEFCDKTCERIYHERNSGKKIIGALMECGCCKQPIPRRSVTTIFCKEKCTPAHGGTFECIICRDPVPLEDFYDYRDKFEDGKRMTKCKKCMTKYQRKYDKKRDLVDPYEKTCLVCGKTWLGKGKGYTCSDKCRKMRINQKAKEYQRKRRK